MIAWANFIWHTLAGWFNFLWGVVLLLGSSKSIVALPTLATPVDVQTAQVNFLPLLVGQIFEKHGTSLTKFNKALGGSIKESDESGPPEKTHPAN